jgi:AraC-like DNA-binding protein
VDELLVTEGMATLVDEAVSASLGRRRARRDRAIEEWIRRSEDVARLINRRFFEPMSLDDIAASVGLSVFHLCRVFKRATGSTIHRYLTCVRLRTSLEQLDAGASDLTQVALSLGFSSHSHFTDSFRREFGMTPSRFRQPTSHEDAALARSLMSSVRARVAT